jgi:hypothetical protein
LDQAAFVLFPENYHEPQSLHFLADIAFGISSRLLMPKSELATYQKGPIGL